MPAPTSVFKRRAGLPRIAQTGHHGSPARNRALPRLGNRDPLERRLQPEIAAEFVWVRSRDGMHFYRHLRTGRFLNLDEDGNCYAFDGHRGYRTSDFEVELAKTILGS